MPNCLGLFYAIVSARVNLFEFLGQSDRWRLVLIPLFVLRLLGFCMPVLERFGASIATGFFYCKTCWCSKLEKSHLSSLYLFVSSHSEMPAKNWSGIFVVHPYRIVVSADCSSVAFCGLNSLALISARSVMISSLLFQSSDPWTWVGSLFLQLKFFGGARPNLVGKALLFGGAHLLAASFHRWTRSIGGAISEFRTMTCFSRTSQCIRWAGGFLDCCPWRKRTLLHSRSFIFCPLTVLRARYKC